MIIILQYFTVEFAAYCTRGYRHIKKNYAEGSGRIQEKQFYKGTKNCIMKIFIMFAPHTYYGH